MTQVNFEQPPWYRQRKWFPLIGIGVFAMMISGPLILIILAVLLIILVPIWLYKTIAYQIELSRFCQQMKLAGRYLTEKDWKKHVSQQAGTVIVDSRHFSRVEHFAWWTPDDLLAIAPAAHLTDDEVREQIESDTWQFPWEEWCWKNYVSPETGKAFLLTTHKGDRFADLLSMAFPRPKVVRHWSGLVKMAHTIQSQVAK